jgi:metallo-beta-lactamase class B
MLRHLTRRGWLEALLGMTAAVAVTAALILFPLWRSAIDRSRGEQSAEPFRIAGNLYYVGGSDSTSFLLTGPDGHVLIDGGHAWSAPMIIASIAQLGFDILDVKVLLNSEPREDHAGGLAQLQKVSGAELWASEVSADAIASGGADDKNTAVPLKAFALAGILRYPAARVDHRFTDGATIRLGPIALTAHITGGHASGCTAWSFPVRDGNRELQVVSVCDLTVPPGTSLVEPGRSQEIKADFERSFRMLRSLPEDIWLTSHARAFGRYRKFLERAKAKDPADPFIDRDGYLRYIDSGEAAFRALLTDQQRLTSRWGGTLAGAAIGWGWR